MNSSQSLTHCKKMSKPRSWPCRGYSKNLGRSWDRPHAFGLKGSRYANMKELRFGAAGGEWRVAFAFDLSRKAVLLVAGDKSGQSQRRFYRELIQDRNRAVRCPMVAIA